MFGLRESDIEDIVAVLRQFTAVETALIFGSRAKGNYKPGSDVDIALKGTDIDFQTTLAIGGKLNEETLMPYHFDVLDHKALNNTELTNHIDRIGQVFYRRDVA